MMPIMSNWKSTLDCAQKAQTSAKANISGGFSFQELFLVIQNITWFQCNSWVFLVNF